MNKILNFLNKRLELLFLVIVVLPVFITLCLQIISAFYTDSNAQLLLFVETVSWPLACLTFFGCLLCFLLNIVSKRNSKIIYIASIVPLALVLGVAVVFLAIGLAGSLP